MIAGGDVLTESRVRQAAAAHGAVSGKRFDFEPMFAELRPIIESADLAICNMEIPVGHPGEAAGFVGRSPFGGNLLRAPYEVAPGLRSVGFDRCSTASNHGYDLGTVGIDSTLQGLETNGISTVGTARSPQEAIDVVFDVNGVRVGHIAFTTYSNTVLPSDRWRINHTRSITPIVEAVAAVRAAGADVVMLSLHVSKELNAAPVPEDRSFVTRLIAASPGLDAVFVHGPHVVQPFEIVNGRPVWWSLGNFVSEMGPPSVGRYASPSTSDGLLAFVRFTESEPGRFVASPGSIAICNDFVDRTVRAPSLALAQPDLPARVRDELTQCLDRTRVRVPSTR